VTPHRSRDHVAAALALTGASLGIVAGLVELTVGPSIRDWVGDKLDTTRLGLATTVIALIALAASAALRRSDRVAGARRVAVALGLLVGALVGFTTVGRLWYIPGALLLAAGAVVLAGTRRDDVAAAFTEAHWRTGLLVACGVFYVFLGATALGLAGVLGLLGGALLWVVRPLAGRSPWPAYAVLLAGALPFAAATWWSAITPLIAVLAIAIGVGVIRHAPWTSSRSGSEPIV
jgi:hypothetical protein